MEWGIVRGNDPISVWGEGEGVSPTRGEKIAGI